MKQLLTTILLLTASLLSQAQLTPDLAAKLEPKNIAKVKGSAIKSGDLLLYGFGSKIKGNDFQYSFPVPGISKTLLIRATDGTQSMEWFTDPVPTDIGQSTHVNFVIPVAIGTNNDPFKLYFEIDGTQRFIFDNRDAESWEAINPDNGYSLTFESISVDANRDRRGFFYLRIPREKLPKGNKTLSMKITAEKCGTQAWFMIYQDRIKPSYKATLSPGIIGDKQQLMIDMMHFGATGSTTLKMDGRTIGKKDIALGNNSFQVGIDAVKEPRSVEIEIITDGKSTKLPVALTPSRNWKINFVEHSHTDIGYTRPQNEILAEHIRYIDYALDYCDLTDHLPDDAQFRWTCEVTWAVEQFLLTRPKEQIERLKRRVREGRIEVAGMLFNFSELPDEQTLVASLQPLAECRKAGIPVEVAMQNDVNGIAWGFADYFPQLGVKYLDMGTHGHRALICFDKPTVFRWQSPSGSEMIAYRAEHYNTGNFFGVERDNFEEFEVRLLNYITSLENRDYPYDIAAVQFSGYFTDNSPPSIAACENVRRWNEKYTSPKIRLAVSTEFIKEVEQRYGSTLETIRGAWPDWWTDGCGAAAREVAVSRYTHTDLISVQGMLSMAALKGAKLPQSVFRETDEVNRAMLFYDEHTTGYSESVRQPHSKPTMDQRALKESYSWEGYRRSRTLSETAQGLLQGYVQKADRPSIVIYNTLNWSRSGIAEAYIDHEILPIDRKFRIIDPVTGNQIAAQPLDSRSDGTYWQFWAQDVPPMSHAQYIIEVSDEKQTKETIAKELPSKIENQWYSMTLNAERGAINSLIDKDLSTELIKANDKWLMGEFVYERLAERGSMEAYHMGEYTRQGLDTTWYTGMTRGNIYDSYNFAGRTIAGVEMGRGALNYKFQIRLYHTTKLIELCYSLVKKSVIEPEGVYISLPFAMDNSKIFVELPGGVMEAGVEQIEGSSNDWNTVQNFAAVRSEQGQIVVGSSEAPLMQFGAINTGRYKAGATPESSNIYSWVMNNYWVTNFNAEQRGEFTWKYYMTSMADNSNRAATRFGWGARVPMPARVLPGGGNAKITAQKPLLNIKGENILVINVKPVETERALMMHIREIGGMHSPIEIEGFSGIECDALGTTLPNGDATTIAPKATKFIKIEY